jgi:RNA polymerase subunit RPABC4/transcription elongation factor Spt4
MNTADHTINALSTHTIAESTTPVLGQHKPVCPHCGSAEVTARPDGPVYWDTQMALWVTSNILSYADCANCEATDFKPHWVSTHEENPALIR